MSLKTKTKILLLCLGASLLLNAYLIRRTHRAEICNKAFVLWFKHNLNIHIHLDKLYEDAVKWVNDPQYQ